MLSEHCTEKLLGYKGANFTSIDSNNKEIHIYFELERKIHNYPHRHQQTDTVHDYRTQVFKDAPLLGLNTFFHCRKRSCVCKNCLKRFYEKNTFLPRYYSTA